MLNVLISQQAHIAACPYPRPAIIKTAYVRENYVHSIVRLFSWIGSMMMHLMARTPLFYAEKDSREVFNKRLECRA